MMTITAIKDENVDLEKLPFGTEFECKLCKGIERGGYKVHLKGIGIFNVCDVCLDTLATIIREITYKGDYVCSHCGENIPCEIVDIPSANHDPWYICKECVKEVLGSVLEHNRGFQTKE